MRPMNYDTLIIGAGHNGLVAAADLAAAGQKVLVLERRAQVGGACITSEIAPGYRASTCSYLVSLLSEQVIADMELARHGYRTLPRNPSSFTPSRQGGGLLLGADAVENHAQISRLSAADADAYPRFEAFLTRVAECLEPELQRAAPGVLQWPDAWRSVGWWQQFRDALGAWRVRKAFARLGEEQPAALRLLLNSARSVLDEWFESEVLKATLATDGVIGAFQPPSAPGTGYVLLHHVMGNAGGARGVWAYVEGGMGAITQAMAACCRERGVDILTGVGVEAIRVENGRARGVIVDGGKRIDAARVISNATPRVTFEHLLAAEDLSAPFLDAVRHIDYASATTKINLAVSALPQFAGFPAAEQAGPQHQGTIHIGDQLDLLEQAYDDAKYGRCSRTPLIEMTIPSVLDTTLAPEGHHIVQLFVQYTPYALRGSSWDIERDLLADRCLHEIDRYAPGFSQTVLHRQVLTPPDLEREFGLTGGNIFHGAMSPSQLLSFRPVPGWADYRTPVKGLYLCGSGTHPGGGVTGMPGRNAARAVLADV